MERSTAWAKHGDAGNGSQVLFQVPWKLNEMLMQQTILDSQANAPPAHQELVFCDYLNLITIRFSPINVY